MFFDDLLPLTAYETLFVFVRVGACLMMMPVFGETYVPQRVRLVAALVITLVLAPAVQPFVPPFPESPLVLFVHILGEVFVGAFIGLFAQILLSSLTTAGTVIAFQMSLANAFLFNPATAQQSSLPGAYLAAIGLTLILVTDMHHLMLAGLAESYTLFTPGALPDMGNFADVLARTVAGSFVMAMQISAPFIFSGLVFYLGLGILARLMPQVQIFFIAIPLQLLKGMAVLLATLSTMGYWFLGYFQDQMALFLPN